MSRKLDQSKKMNYSDGITTLIFDLGGVIVNLDWDLCVNNFKKISVNNMDSLISTTLQKGFILEYEQGEISSDDFRREVRKYASEKVSDEEINYAWTSLLVDAPEEKLQLLLDLKKKYRIFMLSNTNELSFEHCRKSFFSQNGHQIEDYFDKCYLSYTMKMNKPEPDIFEALLKDAGLRAEECLFLDDGIHNIKTASELNFNTEYIEPYSSVTDWDFLKHLKK